MAQMAGQPRSGWSVLLGVFVSHETIQSGYRSRSSGSRWQLMSGGFKTVWKPTLMQDWVPIFNWSAFFQGNLCGLVPSLGYGVAELWHFNSWKGTNYLVLVCRRPAEWMWVYTLHVGPCADHVRRFQSELSMVTINIVSICRTASHRISPVALGFSKDAPIDVCL